MEGLILSDIDAAKMLITILFEKGVINEQTVNAVYERISEMRGTKSAA